MSKHIMSASCKCGASFRLENDTLYGFTESERRQFSMWRERHGGCRSPQPQMNIEKAVIILAPNKNALTETLTETVSAHQPKGVNR